MLKRRYLWNFTDFTGKVFVACCLDRLFVDECRYFNSNQKFQTKVTLFKLPHFLVLKRELFPRQITKEIFQSTGNKKKVLEINDLRKKLKTSERHSEGGLDPSTTPPLVPFGKSGR